MIATINQIKTKRATPSEIREFIDEHKELIIADGGQGLYDYPAAPDLFTWMIAYIEGKPVGMISAIVEEIYKRAVIENLYVLPEHRRYGAGINLVNGIRELLPDYELVTLATDDSLSVFARAGFTNKQTLYRMVR